jgi:hypothetical protein
MAGLIYGNPGVLAAAGPAPWPSGCRLNTLGCFRLRWPKWRRFEPSSSPSASYIWAFVALRPKDRRNPAVFPDFSRRRIQWANPAAPNRAWRTPFSPDLRTISISIVPDFTGPPRVRINPFSNPSRSTDRNGGLLTCAVSGQFGIYEFDSCRPSHAFLFSENFLSLMRKARQTRAFLIADSLQRLMFELSWPEIPESLQPNSIKLPFSGDAPWRRRNKSTAWQRWQCVSVSAGPILNAMRSVEGSRGSFS